MPQFSATRGEWRVQLGAPAAHGTLLRGRDSVARTLRTGGSNHSRTSTMSIPVAHDRAGPVGDVDAAQNLAALLPIGPELKARIRVLIVDDEHTLRESCATVLRQEGYDVTVCGRGQDALDLLKRRGFDLVLVDLYMSQVDRSEEHTSELQSRSDLVCRLLLEKKNAALRTSPPTRVGPARPTCALSYT